MPKGKKMDKKNQDDIINKDKTSGKKQWKTPELTIEDTEHITSGSGNNLRAPKEDNLYRPS